MCETKTTWKYTNISVICLPETEFKVGLLRHSSVELSVKPITTAEIWLLVSTKGHELSQPGALRIACFSIYCVMNLGMFDQRKVYEWRLVSFH